MEFRSLKPDEISIRIAHLGDKGAQLLLYKDARCDMDILDETVGVEKWQRRHYECKGNLYCSVGIECGTQWIWKDDAGAESRAEKEKGEASDSFKRACVNWGIGRELYTAPFIWVARDHITIEKNPKTGKETVKSRFVVTMINCNKNREIIKLAIWRAPEKGRKEERVYAYVEGSTP